MLAREPCVTDVLCSWETYSQTIQMCVCTHFGPHSSCTLLMEPFAHAAAVLFGAMSEGPDDTEL